MKINSFRNSHNKNLKTAFSKKIKNSESTAFVRNEKSDLGGFSPEKFGLAGSDFFSKMMNFATNSDELTPIKVPDEQIEKLFDENGVFSFKNIKGSLNETNLYKYVHGFPLEYPRRNFISDFQNLVSDLSPENEKIIYDNFNFKINDRKDIIKYPNPEAEVPQNIDQNMQKKMSEAQELINKFMIQNKVSLSPEDKKLENLLNETIKIFPEFITLIGKRQHRGDTMDFHTLDVIKRVYNNPEFENIPDEDKKILFIALLFHDFSKQEATVDSLHPVVSALYAKEIIKKLPLDEKNKERICNFIKHSHFATNGDSEEQIAMEFKTLKEFKIAEILGRADSASAGFRFIMSDREIVSVQDKIKKLNQTEN